MFLLLLQKTTKSVQRHRHEFLAQWLAEPGAPAVTPDAWTQDRAKFQHTASFELNQEVLLPLACAPEQAARRRTWRGHRLLGVDGSSLRLPTTGELFGSFGEKPVTNQCGATRTRYPEARMSVLCDPLNDLGLDARLEAGAALEGGSDDLVNIRCAKKSTLASRLLQRLQSIHRHRRPVSVLDSTSQDIAEDNHIQIAVARAAADF